MSVRVSIYYCVCISAFGSVDFPAATVSAVNRNLVANNGVVRMHLSHRAAMLACAVSVCLYVSVYVIMAD
jgi:hypothetical protein